MKRLLQFRGSKFGLLIVLLITLITGMALSGGMVAGQTPTTPNVPGGMMGTGPITFGQVLSTAPDKSSFVIQSSDQNQATINVNQSTTYIKILVPGEILTTVMDLVESLIGEGTAPNLMGIAGLFSGANINAQAATFDDIVVGEMVSVSAGSNNLASQVLVIKLMNVQSVRGPVTAIDANTITITPAAGNAVTINWDNNTRFIFRGSFSLQTGQTATVIYNSTSQLAMIIGVRAPVTPAASPTVTPSTTPMATPEATPGVVPSATPFATPTTGS